MSRKQAHLNRSDLRHGRVAKYIEAQAKLYGTSHAQFVDDYINVAVGEGQSEQGALHALIFAAERDHEGNHHGRVEHG